MENLTLLKNSIVGKIACWILLFAAPAIWAQPVVKVPPGCTVVVTGTGAGVFLGPGGTVGNGGIVVMPDPFDFPGGSGDFNVVPNGTTITGWSLLGDISRQTANIPPAPPVQGAPAVGTLNIESYNRLLRPAETSPLSPLSDPKWGRSKGRVTLSYLQAPCNSSITFEIYKRYNGTTPSWVPPIVGPDCLLPNTTYTYSVDQIASDNATAAIGFDKYYWSGLPTGSTGVYTSADESSITFTTGPSVPASTVLTCCYGRANQWDGDAAAPHTTCVSKNIGSTPVAPNFTTPPPPCLATGSTSFNVVMNPSSIIPGYVYTWTAPGTSWTLAQSGTQNANVAVTGMDNNPGSLTLTINNGACLPVTFTYNINRNFVAPLAISGATCVNAGSTNTYSIPANAQINPTTWTLPAGWNIVSTNAPGSVVGIQVPPGTAAGAYTITAAATNCPGTSISLTVNVRPATPTFVTSPPGTSPVCVTRNGGPAVTYTVTTSPGATGYQWTFPSGWSPASITTATPTVSVTPGGSGASGTISVVAIGASGCNSPATNYVVGYNPVTPSTITATCWNMGVAGTTTVTVANAPSPFYGNYTVTSSPAGLFGSYSVNPVTGVITLNTLASASGPYTLTITHTTTSCGSSSNSYPITVAGNGATVAITANVPGPGNCDQYTVSSVPPGATIAWYVNGVLTTANGTTVFVFGNTLVLCGNTAPTSVCAQVSVSGCTTLACSPTVGTHGARPAAPAGDETNDDEILLFPNPNNGNFKVVLNVPALAIISDTAGRAIKTLNLQKGENDIKAEGIAKGTYIISFEVNGKKETRQFIVK
jgi:hypothetical protein